MPKRKKENIDWGNERVAGAAFAASELFSSIKKEYGEATAKAIFNSLTKAEKAEQAELRNWLILHRYDLLPKPPNTMDLVRQLSTEGLGTLATVEHRVRELLRKRTKAIAEGTWPRAAPPWPWWNDNSSVKE